MSGNESLRAFIIEGDNFGKTFVPSLQFFEDKVAVGCAIFFVFAGIGELGCAGKPVGVLGMV
ncbi:MAG: hypothetical protein HC799_08430 [Limnothrix sp. RL_2_0]|nr:hypothetical protein [Limnothrix sp. RL_2_0]